MIILYIINLLYFFKVKIFICYLDMIMNIYHYAIKLHRYCIVTISDLETVFKNNHRQKKQIMEKR